MLSYSVYGMLSYYVKEMLVCNVNGMQIYSWLEIEKFQLEEMMLIFRGFEMDYVLVMVKFCVKIMLINLD